MTHRRAGRPGLAVVALVAIGVITMAWWALALWPAGAAEPEWLSRTRAACFGAAPGGLPDAGGWVLLVGEPLGMVGLLVAIWGRSLREDLRILNARRTWRIAGMMLVAVAIGSSVALAVRVRRAYAFSRVSSDGTGAVLTRLGIDAPVIALTDQRGRRVSLADFRDRRALITFAYGHCTTVCPTIVHDVQAARRSAGGAEPVLVVITLDPWRDTPDRLPTLAAHWTLVGDDRVLSGDVAEVEAALDALGVGRRRDTTTGDIEHGGTVMLLDQNGKIAWRLDGGVWRLDALLRRRRDG
jgi:cytochrome oxidase Cu insertion factor (SCO1/SenC/PrrC family)